MNYTFRQKIPRELMTDDLLSLLELELNQRRYGTERTGDRLLFKRKISPVASRFQILVELFRSLTTGQIYLDENSPGLLICCISYLKHIVVCWVFGITIGLMFSWLNGFYWLDFFKIANPIILLSVSVGVLNGNARLKRLVSQAMEKIS
ncbi:hypothetical protein [Gaoshiqia sediminis]|uniref:Uncharacterized protein n=1 Tax=Gaoshiqia sediminis TaxID=2986998 RepID=A0AA42C7B5_9BACT|nr:hypothetical protein [Gaoshiqia sediminis]MCW0483409.1 hypothetical protein [Gaoshiqia sediminis]